MAEDDFTGAGQTRMPYTPDVIGMSCALGVGVGLFAAAMLAWAFGMCHWIPALAVSLAAYGSIVEASERLRAEKRYRVWEQYFSAPR